LRETVQVKLNLEMAAEASITQIAVNLRPQQATLVPERREEVTTEGGLDAVGNMDRVRECVHQLHAAGIEVSLFIDPDERQIEVARVLQVAAVELHTGSYADAAPGPAQQEELLKLQQAGRFARDLGLTLHFGHGLTYRNVTSVAAIPGAGELNIGHSIVARAVMVGFQQAVREMKLLIQQATPAQ
jgi:pyridoxine 5-phosphate synthase